MTSIFGKSKKEILRFFAAYDKIVLTKHKLKFIDKYVIVYETRSKTFNYYFRTSDPKSCYVNRNNIKHKLELKKTKLAKLL